MHATSVNKLGALGVLVSDRLDGALDDLSPSAAAVLSMLHFKPALTTTELAAICDVRQPTAVRLVDGLVRMGYVERREPQGRVTPLAVTEAGRRRATAIHTARLEALGELFEPLTTEERSVFEPIVDRILAGATISRASARTTCRLCEHDVCGPTVCPVGLRADELEGRASEAVS